MTAPWDSLVTERMGIGDDLTLDVIYEPKGRVTKEMLFEDAIRLVANARGWHTPEQIDELRRKILLWSFSSIRSPCARSVLRAEVVA